MTRPPVKSQRTRPTICPNCGKSLDGITGEGDPEPGCVTICSYCLGMSVFTDTLDLRKFAPGEYEDLEPQHREMLDRLRSSIHKVNEDQKVIDRMIFNKGEAIDPHVEKLLETGGAALGGVLCSDGPPPRRWRPAHKGRCSNCRREIWLSPHGPQQARLRLCIECAIRAVRKSVQADS